MSKDGQTPKVVWVKKTDANTPATSQAPQVVDKEAFRDLTDIALKRSGVPRDYLFEYPYNEFESRNLIEKAEATVIEMLNRLGLKFER